METHKEPQLTQTFKQLLITINRNSEVLELVAERLGNETTTRKSSSATSGGSASKGLPDLKRPEKVRVEVKTTFMKINDIDTVDQKFEAEIFVQAKWEEPMLDNTNIKEFDGDVMWDPKLLIMNLDGEFLDSRSSYCIRDNITGYKHTVVYKFWRFRGFFKENLELEHFPMDVQDLTISVSTERSDDEVELIEDQFALSSINTKTFLDAQEWDIYEHVETYRDLTTVEYASSTEHPILHIQCRVSRKVGYFVWNIIVIVLLITGLTFATFAIEPESSDRLAVTITLFLTAVAFKLVVKQSLPTISYLTYLDLYVLSALMFLGLHAIQNASLKALTKTQNKDQVKSYDNFSIVSLAIIFLMFHIIFGVYIRLTASKRRRTMKEKDVMYQQKRKYLERFGSLTNLNSTVIKTKKTGIAIKSKV